MTNDLLNADATLVYGEPFETLGFRFATAVYDAPARCFRVALRNGLEIAFSRELLNGQAFENASDTDLELAEVSAWSVYFPRIDEGFSLEPLAFGDFGNEPWDSRFLSTFANALQPQQTAA